MKTRKRKSQTNPSWAPKAPVLLLRTCAGDGTSYGGFRWPLTVDAIVEAPDWDPSVKCGNGLHGWLWGSGDWGLKAKGNDCKWMVLEADQQDVVDLDGKVKVPRCRVVSISENWHKAMAFIRSSPIYKKHHKAIISATGSYGHASATGDYGCAVAVGYYSRVRCGKGGFIAATWHDETGRRRLLVGYAGESGIEADKWYRVKVIENRAAFEEVK